MIKKKKKLSAFEVVLYAVFGVLALVTLYPFYNVLIVSLSNTVTSARYSPYLYPHVLDFTGYKAIIKDMYFFKSLGTTVFVTVVGVALNMTFSVVAAYVLSKKRLAGRNFFLSMILFTMLFSGGLIPTYLVVSSLGMLDTYWALWIPGAISAFNMIILRNSIQGLPEELIDAAKIDGCGEWRTLSTIILPLTKASLATFTLFYAVGHWNSYFSAILYIKNTDMWPIQVWLRQIVMEAGGFGDTINDIGYIPPQSIQYAVIVFATLPILVVYPFVQKYFTKGILVGSVKG